MSGPDTMGLGLEPLVTAVIPCHDAAPYIRQAVESLLQQTQKPDRILVIDDASTDGSSAVLDELARSGVIDLVRNIQRSGKPDSLNRVFESITTRYIALLDADDIALPERLERQVEFMNAHPRVGCSSSFVRYINASGTKLANGVLDLLTEADFQRYMSTGEPFGLFCPAVIIRCEVLRNPALRFRPQFWPADDIDLWNRIAEAGWLVLAQPEFLTHYRIHSSSAVTANARRTREQFEWLRECLRARRAGHPEPTRAEFEARIAQMPWYVRLNRTRKLEAKAACRAAGFAYSEGRYLRASLTLLRAFCLQPGYVSGRLSRQLRNS